MEIDKARLKVGDIVYDQVEIHEYGDDLEQFCEDFLKATTPSVVVSCDKLPGELFLVPLQFFHRDFESQIRNVSNSRIYATARDAFLAALEEDIDYHSTKLESAKAVRKRLLEIGEEIDTGR